MLLMAISSLADEGCGWFEMSGLVSKSRQTDLIARLEIIFKPHHDRYSTNKLKGRFPCGSQDACYLISGAMITFSQHVQVI
jgi:hypothetical protein